MIHPMMFPSLKFGVRGASAFVGHSFAVEDQPIIERLLDFFSKLGLICDTGMRSEPSSISDKVRSRINEAEIFVAIFTRRGTANVDGSYSTSAWVVEEKSYAIAQGKRVLLFVEEGVSDIGGMQGDMEYIKFNRDQFGDALISAVDYIFSITRVPLEARVEGNSVTISMRSNKTPTEQLDGLRKEIAKRPKDVALRLAVAAQLNQMSQKSAALKELEDANASIPNHAQIVHQLGHQLQDEGRLDDAITHFERAIALNPTFAKNYLCFAKALYEKAQRTQSSRDRKRLLERCQKFLIQGESLSDEKFAKEIRSYLFIVTERLNSNKS